MAEFPSPDDDHRRAPPDRPDDVIGLISETLGEDKRTKNLILIVLAAGVTAAILVCALVVVAKGVHGLENRAVWIPGGVVGGAYLVKIVIWVRRLSKGSAVSDDAAVDEQPMPPPLEQSHSQVPQGRISQQARRSRPRRRPPRKR
jgi:hypothetical protein